MMQFLKQVPSIRFMQRRRQWYWLSAAMIVASIAVIWARGLNLTVDFTGGVVLEVGFSQPIDLERARAALDAAAFEDYQVRNFGTASELEIRLPPAGTGEAAGIQARVMDAMRTLDAAAELRRTESVGPQVSRQLGEQ